MEPEDASLSERARALRLLFIHHSCGGQWLAPVGPDLHADCIYQSARNGGGLRQSLREAGFEVHEASYGSRVGERTDIRDWPGLFGDRMEEVLTCDHQDRRHGDSRRNDVVVFKSCFPNNLLVGRGEAPGDPEGEARTLENAKAAYRALLPAFAAHPAALFVAVSAPPLARRMTPLAKSLVQRLLGRPTVAASGPLARELNDWLKDPEGGWLSSYPGDNAAVFDLYDLLTGHGLSDFSHYPTGRRGGDSHPSSEGNRRATEAFLPFLEGAVRRAGLAPDELERAPHRDRRPEPHPSVCDPED